MVDRQRRTLELFIALKAIRRTWAGSLLLGLGLQESGRALALAALAAGAASLFMEADEAQVRAANREGCFTFSVTTLDEALRALKNEVRQARAVTLALSGSPTEWMSEMVERGVQPQAVALSSEGERPETPAVAAMLNRGAQLLLADSRPLHPTDGSALHLNEACARALGGGWQLQEHRAANLRERRDEDLRLLAETDDNSEVGGIGRAWLLAAPSLSPRALVRAYLAPA